MATYRTASRADVIHLGDELLAQVRAQRCFQVCKISVECLGQLLVQPATIDLDPPLIMKDEYRPTLPHDDAVGRARMMERAAPLFEDIDC